MANTILVALMGEPDHILNGQRSPIGQQSHLRTDCDCRDRVHRGPGLTPGELSRT